MGEIRRHAAALEDMGGRNQIWDSKIRMPKENDGHICRTGLVRQVSLADARATVFCAGAGYGKTALMAEIARGQEGRYLWYRADCFDNNPAYFAQGLLYGLSRCSDGFYGNTKTSKNGIRGGILRPYTED